MYKGGCIKDQFEIRGRSRSKNKGVRPKTRQNACASVLLSYFT